MPGLTLRDVFVEGQQLLSAGQVAWMTQAYADKAVREGAAWVDPAVTASMAQALMAESPDVVVHVWQYAVELDEDAGTSGEEMVP